MKNHMRFRLGIILSIIWCLVLTNLAFSTTEELEAIKAAIKARGAQWTPRESWVTRLSPEEFRKLLGARDLELEIVEPTILHLVTGYPSAIDWRNKDGHNWITSVKNQGEDCGSCVSFAAVATLESLTRIEQNQPDKDVDLSEMDICNCHYYLDGLLCCSGWYNSNACSYLWNNGAPDEVCWPYEPINMPCSNTCYNWQERAVKITNYGYTWGEEACKTYVAIAPILAEMAVYKDFRYYSDGIYEHVWGELAGYHSVCIVGYDADNWPLNYWIVKNSWGDDWGENGFFRIKMGECGIETIANYWMSGAVLPTPPTAPSNLTANAITDTQVNLGWTDNSNNESGFEIQRKEAGGIFSLIDTVEGDVTSYEDKTVSGETTYYYKIRAYNVGGNSAFSNTTSVTTPPIAPSNLNAEVLSSSKIRVTWQDNSNIENGFKIQEKKEGGSWQLKSTVGANVTSKDITGLDEGRTYCYRVRAYSAYGNSDWSNTDCDTTPSCPSGVPAAPSNLTTSPDCFKIKLTWEDNSTNEQGFKIKRKEPGGSYSQIAVVGENVTEYWNYGLPCLAFYYYKVRAYNANGNSNYSNEALGWTKPCKLCYGYSLSLTLTTDKQIISSGESVTYTYEVKNVGEVDLTEVEITDERFGKIATNFTLIKGKARTFARTVALTETTTNLAEAAAIYYHEGKTGSVKTKASTTVEVRK